MLKLPVELRRLCLEALEFNIVYVSELDHDYFAHDEDDHSSLCSNTLKALRLVNKELGTLATEQLFRTAIVHHNDESAERLKNILASPLSTLVRRVVINTSDDPEYSGGGQEPAGIEESFEEAIPKLKDFLSLNEVEVKFARECAADQDYWEKEVRETADYRMQILEIFWATLRQVESLETLTIKNLQDYHDEELFASGDFVAVRKMVSRLHLQIATEYEDASPENSIEKPALHDFFTNSLPDIYLKPMADQLTHLTLYGAECYWGVWPYVDFQMLPILSKLKSLSLGNLAIANGREVEWIIGHGNTLQELLLDDCMIATALKLPEAVAKDNFPESQPITKDKSRWGNDMHFIRVELRWHTVFQRFMGSLPKLKHFAIGSGNWDSGQAFEERHQLANRLPSNRYGYCDCGIGPSQWDVFNSRRNESCYEFYCGEKESPKVTEPDCGAEDLEALTQLMQSIQFRERSTV